MLSVCFVFYKILFQVTTEIFPEVIPVLTDEINIWIIIGGCVGGVVLLIAVGVLLWKVRTIHNHSRYYYDCLPFFKHYTVFQLYHEFVKETLVYK